MITTPLQRFVARLAPPVVLAFIVVQLVASVYPHLPLAPARAALAAAVILCGITVQSAGLRVFTALFVLGGLALWSWQGLSVQAFLELGKMAGIAVLIFTVPVAGWLFERRPYGQNLLGASRRWLRSSFHLHGALLMLSALLSAMVGMASLAILYPLLAPSARNQDDVRTLSVSLLRGYVSTLFWAPTTTAVALAVDFLHQPIWAVLPAGLFLCLLTLATSMALEYRYLRPRPCLDIPAGQADGRMLWELAVAVSVFMGALFLTQHWTRVGLLTAVPLAGIAFTAGAFALRQDWAWLAERFRRFWGAELYPKTAEGTGMLAAGFFLAALEATGLQSALQQSLGWLGQNAAGALLWVVPLVIILLGMAGMPAMVGIAGVFGILQGHELPVFPPLVALSAILGAVIISVSGPVVMPIFLLAALSGQPVLTTGFRWNRRFAATLFVVVQVALLGLAWVLG